MRISDWSSDVCSSDLGEEDYSRTGTIDFVDNALSTGSGTIGVRAIVPNADGKLRPGMFGQLQLAASAPQPAEMVPDTAIGTDGARRVVHVIGATDAVQERPVHPGPVTEGLERQEVAEGKRVAMDVVIG